MPGGALEIRSGVGDAAPAGDAKGKGKKGKEKEKSKDKEKKT